MYQFNIDFFKKMQYYAISQLRQNKDYINLCNVIGNDYNDLKKISEYILKSINIDKAEGIWLDYLGWLVGTTRSYFDIGQFFSVNSDDINVEKYFWFPGTAIGGESSLNDVLFRRRIKAKIGYNISKCTREENIYIIKNMTFAKKIKIKRVKVFNREAFTVVGSPTITDDGIATFNNVGNYLKTSPINFTSNFEINISFSCQDYTGAKFGYLFGEETSNSKGLQVYREQNRLILRTYNNENGTTPNNIIFYNNLELNKEYNLKIKVQDTSLTLTFRDINNILVNQTYTIKQISWSDTTSTKLLLGRRSTGDIFNGSIDLKQFSISVDGKEVFSGNKQKPLELDITLIGNEIIQTPTFKEDIEKVLGTCVGVRNLEVLGE